MSAEVPRSAAAAAAVLLCPGACLHYSGGWLPARCLRCPNGEPQLDLGKEKKLGINAVTLRFQAQTAPVKPGGDADFTQAAVHAASSKSLIRLIRKGEGSLKNVEGEAGFQTRTLFGAFSCSAVTVWTHLLFSPAKSAALMGAKNSNPICNA